MEPDPLVGPSADPDFRSDVEPLAVPDLVRRAWRRWYRPPDKHWARVVMNRDIHAYLESLPSEALSALEVSGQSHGGHGWKSYERVSYPAFDLCEPPPLGRRFDLVICEQVLEHVRDPWRAAQTLHDLCIPGGRLVVSTPFLIKVHPSPDDFWRFTPRGLAVLLQAAGFELSALRSWGNRRAVAANLREWAPHRPWRSLRNDALVPLVVWAIASRPLDHGGDHGGDHGNDPS